MPKGRPQASWFVHVESYLKDTGMASLDDGQTGAEGVPSQIERGDALVRGMAPHLT